MVIEPAASRTVPALRVRLEGREVRVDGVAIVGRDPRAQLVTTDPRVSRRHIELRPSPLGWFAVDLGSTNGTFHQGQRVQSLPVTAPVELMLGQASAGLRLELEPDGGPTAVAPAAVAAATPPPSRPAAPGGRERPRPAPPRGRPRPGAQPRVGPFRFLFSQLSGYRLVLLLSVAMAFGQVGADILSAFPLKFILDKVINHRDPGGVWNALIAPFNGLGDREGLHAGEVNTVVGVIVTSAVLLVAFGLIGAAVSYVQLAAARKVGYEVTSRLRTQVFEHLLRLSLNWHGRMKTGDVVQRLTGNVADIEKLIIDGLVDLLAGLLTLLGVLVVMLAFNWELTLLSIIVLPLLFSVVLSYTRRIKTATKKASKAAGQIGDVATEDMRAIAEVKSFNLEERESDHFREYVDRYRAMGLLAGRLEAEFQPLVAVILVVSTAALVLIGAYVGTDHTFQLLFLTIPGNAVTIGTLTVFLAYLKELYQPMRDLSKLMFVATNAASGAERIQEVLEHPEELFKQLEEPDEEGQEEAPFRAPATQRLRGAIAFEGVEFGYHRRRPVLNGVDLRIGAGEKVALVGLSGSGKTTLVTLIPRFYRAWRGRVAIDAVDVRDYELPTLRRNISVVLQESILFEGTIRDNIALGRPGAGEAEIVDAARKAQIHEQVRAMPQGYDTPVLERGKNLSGGQRQRLSIARAILRDAPILILDEPTASLDVEAEAEVMLALDRLVEGRTVVMISHRLSTLGHIDRIAVLASGRVAEEGSFEALRASGGMFARMYDQQNRYGAVEAKPVEAEAGPIPESERMLEMGTMGWDSAVPLWEPDPEGHSVAGAGIDAERLSWLKPVPKSGG